MPRERRGLALYVYMVRAFWLSIFDPSFGLGDSNIHSVHDGRSASSESSASRRGLHGSGPASTTTLSGMTLSGMGSGCGGGGGG